MKPRFLPGMTSILAIGMIHMSACSDASQFRDENILRRTLAQKSSEATIASDESKKVKASSDEAQVEKEAVGDQESANGDDARDDKLSKCVSSHDILSSFEIAMADFEIKEKVEHKENDSVIKDEYRLKLRSIRPGDHLLDKFDLRIDYKSKSEMKLADLDEEQEDDHYSAEIREKMRLRIRGLDSLSSLEKKLGCTPLDKEALEIKINELHDRIELRSEFKNKR